MPTGPAGIEKDSVDAMEGKRPMILKAIAPTSIVVKVRLSSCLYPSFAKAMCQSNLFQLIQHNYTPKKAASLSSARSGALAALVELLSSCFGSCFSCTSISLDYKTCR